MTGTTRTLAAALLIGLAAAGVGGSTALAGTTLDFEGIGPAPAPTIIPEGYGGFDWGSFLYIDGSSHASGLANAATSGAHVAYNVAGDPASIASRDDVAFDFLSVSLTAVWNDDLDVLVEGFAGAMLMHSRTVTVDASGPMHFDFDYSAITSLKFTASGGTPAFGSSATHFALDDFESTREPTPIRVAGVPEPSGLVLGAAAGLGAWGARRRRR